MDIKEEVRKIMNSSEYVLDITELIPIKCKRAYIQIAEVYEKDKHRYRIYENKYLAENEFEDYLYQKITEIKNSLKDGSLSLDGECVVIEFEDGSSISTYSSEWLYIGFDKK